MANKPDIKIKKQKEENVHTDRCGNTSEQECHAKRSKKENKYMSFCTETQRMWDMKFLFIPVITGATTKVKNFKEKFGSHTSNTFNRLTTKDRYN